MYLIGNRLFLHTLVFAAVLTISGSAPSSAQEPDICSANADNPAAAPISPATKPQYLTAFKRKVAEIQQQKPELLLLGDSITHNWENTGPDSSENLHAVWQRYFGKRNTGNLGFSGDTTAALLWRIEHGELDGINPKVIVLLIGTNNAGRCHWTAAQTADGIETIVKSIGKRLPNAKILVLGLLPNGTGPKNNAARRDVNQRLAKDYGSSESSEVMYKDLGDLFLTNGELNRSLYIDGSGNAVHPNAEGAEKIAQAIAPIVNGWLGPH